MNRITMKFNELSKKHKKALITYITGGDPSIEKTEELIYAMERGGADIIEIGIPFSDPLADGPVIQKAALRAFDGGITIEKIMNCIEKVRQHTEIPLLYLAYYNTIFHYGAERFIEKCKRVGIDGLIIPDLPLEERGEIMEHMKDNGIALIPLVAPTSRERIRSIVQGCEGFVYCVSSLGVTGTRAEFDPRVEAFLKEVKESSFLPTAVGFGISDGKAVQRFQQMADGAIVGSALVKVVEKTNGDPRALQTAVEELKEVPSIPRNS